MTKIYCRDEEEKTRLQTKYPNVDAEWKDLPDDRIDKLETPLVCNNDEPLETCPMGEQFIAQLATSGKKE